MVLYYSSGDAKVVALNKLYYSSGDAKVVAFLHLFIPVRCTVSLEQYYKLIADKILNTYENCRYIILVNSTLREPGGSTCLLSCEWLATHILMPVGHHLS